MTFVPNKGLRILTPRGYRDFGGVSCLGTKSVITLGFTNHKTLTCTVDHKIITPDGPREAGILNIGDRVLRQDGRSTRVKSISEADPQIVYDIIEVDGGHTFIANGIEISNCEFVTDDETLIDPVFLTTLKVKREPEFYTGTVRWYEEPRPNQSYLVALDPSLGTGGDFAAIQVFSMPDLVQVAEWQSKVTPPRGQVATMMQILHTIDGELRDNPEQMGAPEIFWTVENNTLGEAILVIIEDTGEERFPGQMVNEKKKKGQVRRFRKGLNTTNRNKLAACSRFKSLIESGRMTINSNNLLIELKNFVSSGGSFAAKRGVTDDLVMSCILITRMLEIVIDWTNGADILRERIGDGELFDDNEGPLPTVV